jgi:hypothetical protein
MSTKERPPISKFSSVQRSAGWLASRDVLTRKRNPEGWLRRRRASMQPWRRGRIRPSTCRDLAGEP